MPSFLAHFLAVGNVREEMARTSRSLLFIRPGMTFSQPIRAVEITPQRTGSAFTALLAIAVASLAAGPARRMLIAGEASPIPPVIASLTRRPAQMPAYQS